MDDTRWEKDAMAWPHSPMSRIRINAKDYSEGTGDLATDAFYNLSPDEFQRLASMIIKAKTATISDYNRCVKHLERLQKLKGGGKSSGQSNGVDKVMELAKQFDDFRMNVGYADIHGRLFADFLKPLVHFKFCFFNNFFNRFLR